MGLPSPAARELFAEAPSDPERPPGAELAPVERHPYATHFFATDAERMAYIRACCAEIRACEIKRIKAMSPEARIDFFRRIAKHRSPEAVERLRREAWAAIKASWAGEVAA